MISFSFSLLLLVGTLKLCLGVKFLLAVPKEAYYDADLVASVSAFGLAPNQAETVTLEYKGLKDSSKILNSTTLEFSSDGSQTWSVVFSWERIQQIDETGLQLVMSSQGQETVLGLTFTQNFGYIFIQTDKPVYTPMQTVKFRVIAVDEYQKLAKYMIKIDIKNPKGIVIDRMRFTAEEAFKAKEFELPKDTPPGDWSITANFEGADLTPGAVQTVKFEVKEYVLPRFSGNVTVEPDVITNGTEWITIKIASRYVYGRPVIGKVDLTLGVWKPMNSIVMLDKNYTGELDEQGHYVKYLRKNDLFSTEPPFAPNNRLYVKAIVTENASQESYLVEDTSTFITHPYYEIDFKDSKKYFKPGFSYTFQAQVSAKNHRRASWVNLFVMSIFFDDKDNRVGGNTTQHTLDKNGEMTQDYAIPQNAARGRFEAIVVDPKNPEPRRQSFEVKKFESPNKQYIHISIATPVTKRNNGVILLRYTEQTQSGINVKVKPDNITVLVLAKGHIIYTTSSLRNINGHSRVELPYRLYAEVTPRMRIIAYYHVQSNTSEFVIDSLLVDTPDVCLEEVSLTPRNSIYAARPKDKFVVEVAGSPNMAVGLVAVDNAVFLLSDKPTLTRSSMFSLLGSHDKGEGSGDGSTMDEILQNSGLYYRILDLDRPTSRRPPNFLQARVFDRLTSLIYDSMTLERQAAVPVHSPQTVRHYFPESWLFEERKLSANGRMDLNLILPDSITTWSFMAVGISSNRGICVSQHLEQRVRKLFFADVRLPYKATRLEEVKVRIAVYNFEHYAVEVTVRVTGSEGLCFSSNADRGNNQNGTSFKLNIEANQARGETVKVIPLRIGDLTLTVDVESQKEKDVVERKLHVVAEGQRIKKSITFVLDPEGKHSIAQASKKLNKVYGSSTIRNEFDALKKTQATTIDLAMPVNVIRGTESCRISAFGDLMGDVITHTIVESRSLIDTPVMNAEEVLGNLAPTIHALLSVNKLGLLGENLKVKGDKYVKRGISRLVNYRLNNYAFALTPGGKPSTWLTAFVLKTLCHAGSLVFIDKENIINKGFNWLAEQVNTADGSPKEQDRRLEKSFIEYKIMLSAEILIAITECKKSEMEHHLYLQGALSDYLINNLRGIRDPMVMAKVTYALMLFDLSTEEYQEAVKRLKNMKRVNKNDQFYWSKVEETNEPKRTPFWYHKAAHASAIEATAYALMVFLQHSGLNIDPIVDWLVGQRNYNGAFIGAMDSAAAIQALSMYSLQKHGPEVDLHCNVSSDKFKEYNYSFKFTEENAIHRESLSNVPIGHILDVLTKGQGLGQMQVNVEYNIPIEKNQNCPFKLTINVKKTETKWSEQMHSNPLCASCNIGCPKPVNATMPVFSDLPSVLKAGEEVAVQMTVKIPKRQNKKGDKNEGNENKKKPKDNKKKNQRKKPKRPTPGVRKNIKKNEQLSANKKQRRSLNSVPISSKKSICVHICLQHVKQGSSDPMEIRIEMLSGYHPVMADIDRIIQMPNVQYAAYDNNHEVLVVQFTQISCIEQSCVTFRAVDMEEVGRLTPARVQIIPIREADPQCIAEYHGLGDNESLKVFCADFSHKNRGECRCFSGLCSRCVPYSHTDPDLGNYLHDLKQLVCKKPVVYQLQIANVTNMDNWVEIDSKVVSVNKTGTDNITDNSIIKIMTQSSCNCPLQVYRSSSEKFYLLSPDVEKLVDRNGNYVYRYLLDQQSSILRIAEPGEIKTTPPSIPYFYLNQALNNNDCI